MLIPYQTDAPIYHLPIVTVGTIVVNVIVFFYALMLPEETAEQAYDLLMLRYGYWLPWQWVTSNYLHGDIMHLLGNMFVLWGFGLVVEGKVGWWRFLLIYNGIGIAECALEQTLALGFSEGGSLGASSIIYGLIAMAMIWAPANEMTCLVYFGFRPFTFDCSIWILAGFSLALEIAMGILHVSFSADNLAAAVMSQMLHLFGAGFGFAVAVVMLRLNWVDCENWDAFSVWSGRNEKKPEERAQEFFESKQGQAAVASKRDTMLSIVRHHLAAGDPVAALAVHRRGIVQMPEWRLPEEDHVTLITGLRSKQLYEDAVLLIGEYLKMHNQREPLIRLALGQILLTKLKKPSQAARVLAKIDPHGLDPQQQQQAASLLAKARKLVEENPYEIAGEDW